METLRVRNRQLEAQVQQAKEQAEEQQQILITELNRQNQQIRLLTELISSSPDEDTEVRRAAVKVGWAQQAGLPRPRSLPSTPWRGSIFPVPATSTPPSDEGPNHHVRVPAYWQRQAQ